MARLVSAEELLVLLNSNTTLIFIAKILLKLFFSNLLHPLNLKAPRMFSRLPIPQWTYFLLVRKIRPFSHEKVVITQSDACRWFYGPIYAKWLPLNSISIILKLYFYISVLWWYCRISMNFEFLFLGIGSKLKNQSSQEIFIFGSIEFQCVWSWFFYQHLNSWSNKMDVRTKWMIP